MNKEFEQLRNRIDALENILCNLATNDIIVKPIYNTDIKYALKDAGVMK